MRTSIEYAKQIFEVLSFSIDQACAEQDWLIVQRDAFAFGFTQSDESMSSAYSQRFNLEIEPDIRLSLNYSSRDPSSPFLKVPAISRFELTLLAHGNEVGRYQNGFDEPISVQDKTFWQELSFA